MKSDKITKYYFHDVDSPPGKLDRRDFLRNLGGGIFIVFTVGGLSAINSCKPKQENNLPAFNAYLRVKEDGSVDCFSGKIEMGQGAITSLAQVLADELEVSLDKVNMIMGDTELTPHDDGTWGSMTTRFHDPLIRAAAAEAREVLILLAAEKLNLPVSQLKAANGIVFDKNDETKFVTYSDLTKGKKIVKPVSEKPALKKPADFNVIGKSHLRLDSYPKVTGKAVYSADIQLRGKMYACVVRPPSHNAKMISCDTASAEAITGTKVVRDGELVAILNSSFESAERAVKAVKAIWEQMPAKADNESIFEYIVNNASEKNIVHLGGDIGAGVKNSKHLFDHEYHDGYKAHAPIETHAATVLFEDGKFTVWASSQTPFGTRQEIADHFKIEKEQVHLKQIFIGGGFGGKIYNQQAVEAARIAKMVEGTPVQLMWSRREEFMYDMFRPASVMKIKSGIDKEGKITLWNFDIYCAGDRGTALFYDVPDHKTTTLDKGDIHPFGTGAWRAPGNYSTTFARESQIDIMAHKIGMDPLEFRLKNMKDSRALNSLQLAAEKFGWSKTNPPKGTGRGIAVGEDAGTFVTVIAEVNVNPKTGHVKVNRVIVGQDMGQVINPEGVVIQAEGCVNMGLGYTLTEDVEFNWKEVKSSNFDNYQIPLFSTIPESIEVSLADAMDQPPQGGGEPAIICIGAAVGNAIFEACGARIFRMPFTPERVLKAMNKV